MINFALNRKPNNLSNFLIDLDNFKDTVRIWALETQLSKNHVESMLYM